MGAEIIDSTNESFKTVTNLIDYTSQSVFLTGKAGTGKSTFLRHLCQTTKKKHIVLAPTGIAAINVKGATLHSFFKIPFHPILPDDPKFAYNRLKSYLKYNSSKIKIIKEIELIIIDEISMVRADIIDFIDKILRIYSGNMRTPFGGKQMLLVGDVFQLEPVVKTDEREILRRFYKADFFFNAMVFREMELVSIELEKVYRQSEKAFISVLNRIRTNSATAADLQLLNTCVDKDTLQNDADELRITLATKRDNVDFINSDKLNSLEGEPVELTGEIKGEFPETSLPTPLTLELKKGAQIMFIKNDKDHRWVNGTLGRVNNIADDLTWIEVSTEDGVCHNVVQEQWENIRYTYNELEKKVEEEVLGVFKQFPIKLAWAITVHKSQGLTFSRAFIDLSGGVFAGGQTYVALSRCTSLDGMRLASPLRQRDVFVRQEIVEFSKHFNDKESVHRALKNSEADIAYGECVRNFNEGDMDAFLENFFTAIHARYDIEKPLERRFIRRKLSTFNRLRQEKKELQRKLNLQQEELKVYATEYYQMGNVCVTQAHDTKAAIASYRKALRLYPRHTDAMVRLAVVLMDTKEYDEATQLLNQAVELSPVLFKAVYNRGKLRLLTGQPDAAATDLSKAVSLRPENAKAHQLFGDALSQSGHEEDAIVQWEIANRLKNK